MKTVFVHLAEGFEEIEAIAPIDILRRAGCKVTTISIGNTQMVEGAHNIAIYADKLFDEADYSRADMLVLPGGMPGSDNLDQHLGLREKLLEAADNGKWLAAICAAPKVLGHIGLLKGKRATCYPGNEKDLTGAIVTKKPIEVDGNIITANGAGSAMEFGITLVELLVSMKIADELRVKMMVR